MEIIIKAAILSFSTYCIPRMLLKRCCFCLVQVVATVTSMWTQVYLPSSIYRNRVSRMSRHSIQYVTGRGVEGHQRYLPVRHFMVELWWPRRSGRRWYYGLVLEIRVKIYDFAFLNLGERSPTWSRRRNLTVYDHSFAKVWAALTLGLGHKLW